METVSKRISVFDDKPEKLRTGHSAFQNMIVGVLLASDEQLNLIVQNMAEVQHP